MCGIVGAVWTEPDKAITPDVLRRMTRVLCHRGPDDQGEYFSADSARDTAKRLPVAALGHRRLSIIDVGGGHQPLGNEDGSIRVVFNGEIYNYRQLRQQLLSAGHRFRTQSDTETLVHLYEDLGPEMLSRLIGMFALAIWDERKGQLLLARDRLGQKPLVYCHQKGRLLFASELKALLEVPGVARQIDPRALDEYLTYQYVPHPRTIISGICKLPPGHYAVYRDDRLEVRPYWQPDFNVEDELPAEEWSRQLRHSLTDAVESQLQSEVPLGAFLSGGTDSTIIVGLMSKLTGGRVRTFSIGFPTPQYDETAYARLVAQRFGTMHEEFRVEPSAVEILPKLVWHFDEPMADSSAVPTWYVSQLTRRSATVALTGDGGDELFAGYPRYLAVWLSGKLDRLPGALRRLLTGKYWRHLPASPSQKCMRRRWKRFVAAMDLPPARRYLQWISIFNDAQRAGLYSDGFAAALPEGEPLEFLRGAMARCDRRDPITAASLADLITYLPCDLMTKVDIASMAHGLECRQPFLDHRVVELAARMPIGVKFRNGRGKRILKSTFADLLPIEVQRRPKMGFGVPLDRWFRHELRDFACDVLLDSRTLGRGLFQNSAISQMLSDHQSGRFDHSNRLWSLLVLELWQRQWLD